MSRVPRIRFKGFEEDWEQRKLGEIGIIITGSTPSTSIKYYYTDNSDEGIVWVTPTDIINNITVESEKRLTSLGQKVAHIVPKNTILVTCIASIGKNTMLIDRGSFNQQINGLIPYENKYEPYFLLTESFIWSNKMKSSAPAGTMQIVNRKEFSEIDADIPDKSEQNSVGAFFRTLDHLITLHQRKLEKLKIIKKSMLENLFPQNGEKTPKIRFSGFTKDWEQRKLGEIVGIYDGVHQTPKYQDNGIMFLSVENIATLQSTKYISEDNFKRDYKVYPQENDILMTRIGDVGTTNVIADKGLKAYYVSLALLKYKSTNPYFLSNAIQSEYVKKELANRTLKTAIPMKINKDEIGKVDVMLPISVQEQNKIGEYFRNIDHLITLHQSKLEKLQKIKKSMLECMFI